MTIIPLPLHPGQIIDEIARFTDLTRKNVEERVELETRELGWNVRRDVEQLGVTPHVYGADMERLYRMGDGFIFETLVFWATPNRQRWLAAAIERAGELAHRRNASRDQLRVLILGDGTGNDTLAMVNEGFCVNYFDVPGSRTFEFAMRRFAAHGLLESRVRLIENYDECLEGGYDFILCLEVLEHLPDPVGSIRDIAAMLAHDGIAVMSESFGLVTPQFPTHLASNARFHGRTPFLCLRSGLRLTWYSKSPMFRPAEYTRAERIGFSDWLRLGRDRHVARRWLETLPSRLIGRGRV